MKYRLIYSMVLAIFLIGNVIGGPEKEPNAPSLIAGGGTAKSKLKWDSVAVKERLPAAQCPSIYEFLGGYTDPMTRWNVEKLKAHIRQLVEDIGGWEEVEKVLHQDEWIFGINGTPSCCPVCEPNGYRSAAKYLELKGGKLVCSKCKTTVFPSKKFPMNHTVKLTLGGTPRTFQAPPCQNSCPPFHLGL